MAVRVGFEYLVKFVKHTQAGGTPITRFSIGDKLKGSANSYQNYDFTIWGEHMPIPENSRVKIEKIDGIESRWYNGKTYFGISGKVTPVQREEIVYEEETSAYTIDKSSVKKKIIEAEEDFVALDEDDTALPFDM